jgi:hypothetical protein
VPLQPPAVNTHELKGGWHKLLARFSWFAANIKQ